LTDEVEYYVVVSLETKGV